MEQFKAEEEDWQRVEADAITHPIPSTICELRDRVAALEAAPDRVFVRNQTGEYLRAGTPVYADPRNRPVSYSVGEARPMLECGKDHVVPAPAAAPVVAVPSDQELWEVQLKVKSQSRPHIGWQVWSPESEPLIAAHRALYDHGYQQGLAAGRAEQPATTELPTDYDYDAPQTLHTVALGMVDTLRRRIGVTDHICDTIERAIREPAPCPHVRSSGDSNWCALAEQQAATEESSATQSDPAMTALELPRDWYPDFADWLKRQMPEGTVIGDPLWWASCIAAWLIAKATLGPKSSPSPAGDAGLVEEVVRAMRAAPLGYQPEARAAILRAAGWLHREGHLSAAALLEREANR
jgi:hypothetical protein